MAAVAVSGFHIQSHQGLQGQVKFGSKGSDSIDQQGFDWLLKSVPGTPGTDYPIFAEVPETKFDCNGLVDGGGSLRGIMLQFYTILHSILQRFRFMGTKGWIQLAKKITFPKGRIKAKLPNMSKKYKAEIILHKNVNRPSIKIQHIII